MEIRLQKIQSIPEVLAVHAPIYIELVRVPSGEFLMGSDPTKDRHGDREKEQPQHLVFLHEYYIGRYPVTNFQYAAFVRSTAHQMPRSWKNGEFPSGKENHPVSDVSWNDAIAFCKWLSQASGKPFRLPSEAEWEKAARGTDGRIFPWGNSWDPTK
jgi:formylglycine-generating enzyme required for sulfatase activity